MKDESHAKGESKSYHDLARHIDVEGVDYGRRHKHIEGKSRQRHRVLRLYHAEFHERKSYHHYDEELCDFVEK